MVCLSPLMLMTIVYICLMIVKLPAVCADSADNAVTAPITLPVAVRNWGTHYIVSHWFSQCIISRVRAYFFRIFEKVVTP